METSQRRVSGKTALTSGQRLKLVVALILALFVAGLFLRGPAVQSPGAVTEELTESECKPNGRPDSEIAAPCPSAAPAMDEPGLVDASGAQSSPSAPVVAHDNRRGRPENVGRAWQNDRANSQGPRPGYTIAELCSAGGHNDTPRCETGHYAASFYSSESRTPTDSDSGYKISGRVLTTDSEGLSGVSIVASPQKLNGQPAITESGTLRFWTVTDALGAYALDGLPEGEYTLRSGIQGPYQSARIAARTGASNADLIVPRNAEAIIEGQVLGSDGGPLEGVTVLPVLLGQPSVLTDDDGRFRLPVSLKPGINTLAVRFQRPGFSEHTGKVVFQSAAINKGETANGAARNIAAMKIVMHPVESWTSLAGAIYSDSDKPLAGRTVELRPLSAQQKYTTTTDQEGNYSFPVIATPADYRLTVFGGADHRDYQQDLPITTDTEEFNVFLESYEFGEVTGQIVNQNGVPISGFGLVLRNSGSRRPNVAVRTDNSGNFAIPAAPAGELVIASQSSPSILVQGLHLSAGEHLHLPLILDWGEHEIRGSVVDARGNPVPASRIILQWTFQSDGVTTKATRRAAADTQGHFAFSNLGPGPHSLQINAPGFRTVDINHDLSRQGYDLTVRLN